MDHHAPTLRPASATDLDAIVSLTNAAYEPYTAPFGYPPVPVTEDYVPRIAAGQVWILEQEDETAGLIVLERHPDHAMIFSVAVDPARHGKGHGSTLLRFAEDQARRWGLDEMRLYTNSKMLRNIAIYTAAGYRETGRRPNPLRPTFIIVDMVKPLR